MTVDSFLKGDFKDATDDDSIEEDEQVRLINPAYSFVVSILYYRHKVTRIWILKEPWNRMTKVLLVQ